MPDLNRPTQTAVELFVHILKTVFPGVFTDTKLNSHTLNVCVLGEEVWMRPGVSGEWRR